MTETTTSGRAQPDHMSDRYFRVSLAAIVIGALISLGVFASVAWRGSLNDSDAYPHETVVQP